MIPLQHRHDVNGVSTRDVRVDDAMSQALDGIRPHRLCVTVHHPVDAPVTDRVHAHMHASIVEQSDEMTDGIRVRSGISAIARIGTGVVLVPVVIQPRSAGPAASVDVELDAAGHEAIVSHAPIRSRRCRPLRNQLTRRRFGTPAKPEREHPYRQRSLTQHLSV